jgi:hypothetical protein
MRLRYRRRLGVGVVAAGAVGMLAALGLVSPASAAGLASGQTLGAGDSRCTDYVRSDNGARLAGYFLGGTGEWTVRRSSTVGGSETVVFQAPAGVKSGAQTPVEATITPPASGDFFYRACVVVNTIIKVSVFSVAYYQMTITSTSPNAVHDIGPETAKVSVNASACGDRTRVSPGATIRLVGTGTVTTGWFISVTGSTNNYEGNWAVLPPTSTNGPIDVTLVLDPEITEVAACGGGSVTGARNTVSFELSIIS